MLSTDTGQDRTQKRASVRVPRQLGEKALRVLIGLNLIDRESKIRLDTQSLVLPLLRELSAPEVDRLRSEVGQIAVATDFFESKTKTARSLEEVLEGELPPSLIASLPASFDVIGDIVVVEFPPEFSGNERVVAAGILKVHKNVNAVFSKAGPVSGDNRIRPLQHLAGEDRTVTVHKEFGCRFKVDLAKAYFSPRLSTEHQRVASMVKPGECVVDMFAGVGPFSILIARRFEKVEVHAVDSNPEAVRLIEENVRLNKLKGVVKAWAGDARTVVEKNLHGGATRVIMNHPSKARKFVDVACQALRENGGVLHYYMFTDGLDFAEKAVKELEEALSLCSWTLKEKIGARAVRGIGPMQWQVVVDAMVAPKR